MSNIIKALDMLSETSVKDLLNKIEDGFDLTKDELKKLISLGLVNDNGNPTEKAKGMYSSLYD